MSYVEVAPSVRPFLSVIQGKLMVEPLRGLAFPLGVGRIELHNFLKLAASQGELDLGILLEDGVTIFNLTEGLEQYMLIYDNDLDQLVTIVANGEQRVIN